jgi:hypothetical protein
MLGRGPGLFVSLLMVAGWAPMSGGSLQTAMPAAFAADQGVAGESEPPGAGSQVLNPHSDLIFRATGAKSCRDCHRAERDSSLSRQVFDNDLVRNLRSKAKGIHGPGRFADCLRCHAGGRKGVERY